MTLDWIYANYTHSRIRELWEMPEVELRAWYQKSKGKYMLGPDEDDFVKTLYSIYKEQ